MICIKIGQKEILQFLRFCLKLKADWFIACTATIATDTDVRDNSIKKIFNSFDCHALFLSTFLSFRSREDRERFVVRAGGQSDVRDRRRVRHGPRPPQHAQRPLSRQGGTVLENGPRRRSTSAEIHPQREDSR